MERLRIENSDLRRQLGSSSEITFPAGVPGPDETFDCLVTVSQFKRDKGAAFDLSPKIEQEGQFDASEKLGLIFVLLYERLLRKQPESELRNLIGRAMATRAGRVASNAVYEVGLDKVQQMRFRLEVLDLIRTEKESNYPGLIPGMNVSWTVTDKGRRYATRQLAALSEDEIIRLGL